jgi:hypothetical protein|nr:MAG TPA: hypothetical protein [Caudoviricetes sp.]
MRICENGIYRDMTPEEIAEMQQNQPDTVPEELTTEKKLELMLAAIPEEPMPDSEPKLGYKWQPIYTPSSGFAWELVEDPTALGTQNNPRYWVIGLAVRLGHYYTTDGVTLKMAVNEGVPESWDDAAYFEEAT